MKNSNKIEISDFIQENDNTYHCKSKELIVFGKTISSDRIRFRNESSYSLVVKIETINKFLMKLADFQKELIQFYNHEFDENEGETADDKWYSQLEIYRLTLILGLDGKCYADVVAGDIFFEDHLLDIELEEDKVYSMQYDG